MTTTTQTPAITTAKTTSFTNLFTLTGYLGDAPRVVNFKSGNSLTEISVGINEPGKEKASWYRVVLWNKVGETAAKYLQKGAKVTVKGQLKFDTWTDKNTGEARKNLKLHVNDIFGLDLHRSKSDFETQSHASESRSEFKPVPAPAPVEAPKLVPAPAPVEAQAIDDEEWNAIPF